MKRDYLLLIFILLSTVAGKAPASIVGIQECHLPALGQGLLIGDTRFRVRRTRRGGEFWTVRGSAGGPALGIHTLRSFYQGLGFEMCEVAPGVSVHCGFPHWRHLNARIAEFNLSAAEPIAVRFEPYEPGELQDGRPRPEFALADWAYGGTIRISETPWTSAVVDGKHPMFSQRLKMASAMLLPFGAVQVSKALGRFLWSVRQITQHRTEVFFPNVLSPGEIAPGGADFESELEAVIADYVLRWRKAIAGFGPALASGNDSEAADLVRSITEEQTRMIDTWVRSIDARSPAWQVDSPLHIGFRWSAYVMGISLSTPLTAWPRERALREMITTYDSRVNHAPFEKKPPEIMPPGSLLEIPYVSPQ